MGRVCGVNTYGHIDRRISLDDDLIIKKNVFIEVDNPKKMDTVSQSSSLIIIKVPPRLVNK